MPLPSLPSSAPTPLTAMPVPPCSLLLAMADYTDWAEAFWVSVFTAAWDLRALSILGLGLPGESAEVLELVWPQVSSNKDALVKELGDVAFHLVLLARMHAIEVADLVAAAESVPASSEGTDAPCATCAIGLTLAAGRVAEVLKKQVRDGAERKSAVLLPALAQLTACWLSLCTSLKLEPAQVLSTSVAKLEARHAKPA